MDITTQFEIAKGVFTDIKPITSGIEKNILEMELMSKDDYKYFESVLKILNIPEELPFHLKVATIYAIRSISFGPDLSLRYKCSNCHQITESVLMLDDIITFPIDSLNIEDKYKDLKIKNFDINEMQKVKITQSYKYFENVDKPTTIEECYKLALALRSKLPVVKKSLDVECFICKNKKYINILDKKFCIRSLSENSIKSLYQKINNMVVEGFGVSDINNMLPFEREMHYTLLLQRAESIRENLKRNLG